MIDFIPIHYYVPLYYNILLLVVFFTLIHTYSYSGFTYKTYRFNKLFARLLLWFLILYMGLRPVSTIFADMMSYAHMFRNYAQGFQTFKSSDIAFYTLMRWLSHFTGTGVFFLVIALLYILPLYYASKRWFPKYYYFAFLILVTSFSFWSYGTNGLRNGVATSLMILAFSFLDNKKIMYPLMLLSLGFHHSMLLIIVLYFLTAFIKNIKIYYLIWFASIILSNLMGSFWENIFIKLGFGEEDKLEAYFGKKEIFQDQFSATGFRWDFLIYSFVPVAISWFFIEKLHFRDQYYDKMVKIYLLANAFWILVIRASFSNRFAYLSWFFMSIIMIYPLLKKVYWKNQFTIIGIIIFAYFSFTYIMNIFVY